MEVMVGKDSGVEKIGRGLEEKMLELATTREQIDRARRRAVRSYQDSKPLVAKLERARSRGSAIGGSYKLDAVEAALREKKEGEARAARSMDEMSRRAEEMRGVIDSLKAGTEEERRARQKLRQALRVKRQKLRAIQLTCRAVRIESEAVKSSLEYAVREADLAKKTEAAVVQLNEDKYWALRRRAEEAESQSEQRITASHELKAAAEESRNVAMKRLREAKEGSRVTRRRAAEGPKVKKAENREGQPEKEVVDERRREVAEYCGREHLTGRKMERTEIGNEKQMIRARVDNERKVVKKKKKKKKRSIIAQIRRFFAKRVTKMFG